MHIFIILIAKNISKDNIFKKKIFDYNSKIEKEKYSTAVLRIIQRDRHVKFYSIIYRLLNHSP